MSEAGILMSLSGSLVNLRAVRRDDYELLCDWREDPESLYLWSSYRHIGTREENEQELERDLRTNWHLCFIIETAVEHKSIGFIYSYDAQLIDGRCIVTTFIDRKHRSNGYGVEAHALFLRYAFAYFDLRKIYSDVYDFNEKSLSVFAKSVYRLEGTFPEHRYFNGSWHTMKRFAFYREDIPKAQDFLDKLEKRRLVGKSPRKGGEKVG